MRQLFKGGNYLLLEGFNCGNYSKEESIQGRKLFAEIRFIENCAGLWYFSCYIYLFFIFQIFQVSLKMRVLRHLKQFASTTSIHGLAYIVRPNGTKRSKIGWALVFIAAVLYASLELRKQVFCKFCEKVVKLSA